MENHSRINLRIIIQGPVTSKAPAFPRKLYYYQKRPSFSTALGGRGQCTTVLFWSSEMTGLRGGMKPFRRLQGGDGQKSAVGHTSWALTVLIHSALIYGGSAMCRSVRGAGVVM